MKFKINYYFDVRGITEIEAKTKEEAEELFYQGEWEPKNDDSDNYNISEIEANE